MVQRKKKSKLKKFIRIVLIIILISISLFSVNIFRADINYKHNFIAEQTFTGFDENGYIDYQPNTNVFNQGFFKSDAKGCGWIATYNVAHYLNMDYSIANIVKYFDKYGNNAYGWLGINPLAIKWFFNNNGVDTTISINKSKFSEIANNSRASILLYVGLKGGHYSTIIPNGDNTYKFYNYYDISTLDEYFNESKDLDVFFNMIIGIN